jgi:uncharacterized membrane protein
MFVWIVAKGFNMYRHILYRHMRRLWAYSMTFGSYCGCHQRPERSFTFRQYQFPICARCTGVFIGQIISVVFLILEYQGYIYLDLIFMSIMFIDWFIQALKIRSSTNSRRLITGILCGFGYVNLLIVFVIPQIINILRLIIR